MPKLTVKQVQAARHSGANPSRPERLGDGGGLYLQIERPSAATPGGAKSWLFRFMLQGRSREMGLGSVDEVTLAQARDAAETARAKLKAGLDPIEARRQGRQDEARDALDRQQAEARAKQHTFKAVAEAYMTAHRAGWRNVKHAAQWKSTLATYAEPVLGDMPVARITTAQVLEVLEPIWSEKTETATRVRTRIEAVLDYAVAKGLRPAGLNPATWRGNLQPLLPRPSKVKVIRHHPALPYQRVGAFMEALNERDASTTSRALTFAILTATRSGETLGATWREVDLEEGHWTIPPERMKAGREHRVPLSAAALAILEAMKPLASGPDSYVFPGERPKRPLSNMALEMLLRRLNPELKEGEARRWCDRRGDAITVHGFRSTFRDWTSEATNFPHELAEAALSHVIQSRSEAAYRRGDLFEKRRTMMEAWATFCARTHTPATVVPLRAVG